MIANFCVFWILNWCSRKKLEALSLTSGLLVFWSFFKIVISRHLWSAVFLLLWLLELDLDECPILFTSLMQNRSHNITHGFYLIVADRCKITKGLFDHKWSTIYSFMLYQQNLSDLIKTCVKYVCKKLNIFAKTWNIFATYWPVYVWPHYHKSAIDLASDEHPDFETMMVSIDPGPQS